MGNQILKHLLITHNYYWEIKWAFVVLIGMKGKNIINDFAYGKKKSLIFFIIRNHFHKIIMKRTKESTINSYKIVVIGSSGVGKTAIVHRLSEDYFEEESQSTVGVEFKTHTISIDNENIKLNIWDTAGQERFRSVSKAYFRNAVGAIIVYAINNSNSFYDLEGWINELYQLSVPNAVVLLVGNKCDLQDREISESEAISFANNHGIDYIETSAKDSTNVEEAFVRLAKMIHDKIRSGKINNGTSPSSQNIDNPFFKIKSEKDCC